jgi:hypothetical protein
MASITELMEKYIKWHIKQKEKILLKVYENIYKLYYFLLHALENKLREITKHSPEECVQWKKI